MHPLLELPLRGGVVVVSLALCAAGPMRDHPSNLVKEFEERCNAIDLERAPINAAIAKTQKALEDYHYALERERPWTHADDHHRREQATRVVRGYDNLVLIRNAELAGYQSDLSTVNARHAACLNNLAAARGEAAKEDARLDGRPDDHSYEKVHGLFPGIGMAPAHPNSQRPGASVLGAPHMPQSGGRLKMRPMSQEDADAMARSVTPQTGR